MKTLTTNNAQLRGHMFFWPLVFLLNTGPRWEIYTNTTEIILTVGMITGLQVLVALITLKILIPNYLNKGQKIKFFTLLLFSLFVASEINILLRYLYFEPFYPQYELFLKKYGHFELLARMFSPWAFKYIFFTKIPLYAFPTAILVAYNFYQTQNKLLRLNEQKRQAELDALKNQLNPHFIFNTLNNLYALALKKSDQTPMVIEKLSNILDYILYRCNDKFVSLKNEIKLIENYIDLEKIRYGKRMQVSFDYRVENDVNIAPLILLTLLENACKHSTSEELNKSTIDILLKSSEDNIYFQIQNSKPTHIVKLNKKPEKIGLANMRKQLELLYPDAHTLSIDDNQNYYKIKLTIHHE